MNKKINLIVIILCGIVLGITGTLIYQEFNYQRTYDGLWIPNNLTQPEALKTAYTFDTQGSWICVNIKGMSIQDIINTCEHESSHEIFAQKCTGRTLECLNEIGVKNTTK